MSPHFGIFCFESGDNSGGTGTEHGFLWEIRLFIWQHRSLQFVCPLRFIFHLYIVTDPLTAMRSILHYANKTVAVKIAISSCLLRIRCLLGCEFLPTTLGRDWHYASWNLIFSLHSQSQLFFHGAELPGPVFCYYSSEYKNVSWQ